MGWEQEYEGLLTVLDALDGELLAADGAEPEEIRAFLSEDGEARRRFLKQALMTGGGVAAANLLLSYRLKIFAQDAPAAGPRAQNEAAGAMPVTLRVNGKSYPLQLEPQVTLLDAIRERIGLTGSKKGCDRGQCGACTVLADGRRINSCLALAASYDGAEITTVEGLARGEELHPVQAAFIKHDGFQCGYCTPGQIMSAVGLINEGCPPGMGVRECMSGNICRCGAYNGIVAAVEEARAAKAGRGD
ncbi:MAG TPA: 2Fe-2S iron-sulfur cluster-binding protein [Pyrinomonadaceae bacterium]|jgi:xanthine dehydrogenase YagT iron-sulfur-binding subunit|nr:2Fe-2S iron-sulfur cluster-binding protein [Pyrinomonadaceae bacterium]